MFDGITLIHGKRWNGSEVKVIQYYAWGHRGRGEVNVCIRRN